MKRLITFAALTAGILSQSFAALSIDLSFDSTEISQATTGTYTITGSFIVNGYGSGSGVFFTPLPQGGMSETATVSDFYLSLQSTSLSGTAEYDSTPFVFQGANFNFTLDSMMFGDSISFYGDLTSDSDTSVLWTQLLTVDLSGTFEVSYLSGNPNPEAISGSYANDAFVVNGAAPAPAVPEPSTYAALAGLATLAFAAFRRRKA
ncbi:MAG: PEP-CTERM sorting domain-containing protein [Verrucomicrobiota bacterium JB022]|nr:PEP-CTERM sorting domain-containing protein [Verrucomicrobiota bacterium JB022]